MVYLIYGKEPFLIKEEIDNIKLNNNIDDNDLNIYDMSNINIKNIIDDINTISLFSEKRMIIVNNSLSFSTLEKNRDDFKYLETYLDHINDNILVFVCETEKLDNRKKIVSLMLDKTNVIECNKYDTKKMVKKMFDNYFINDDNIKLLIDRVGDNLDILNMEIDKIKIFKNDDLNITSNDIISLTTKNIDTNIFHLIDNIILNNKDKALESYFEMLKYNEEPIKIIVMLANQFRLMYQVKCLQGTNIFDMMKILNQKKYTIEMAIEKSRKLDKMTILKKLYQLADLDIKIKKGYINKNIALELFILEY